MEIEDKESIESGSPVETESLLASIDAVGGGGGVVPEVMSMSMEKSLPVAATGGGGESVLGSGFMSSASGDLVMTMGTKKKRGRPRKYDADGNLSASYMKKAAAARAVTQPEGFTLTTPSSSGFSSSSKRGRGRPPGSGNWQILASLGELFSNTAGGDFTPHVVTVYAGEDVAGKILTFSQNGTRGICILSANGSVSNVTIRQPGSSGGLLTYEGRFEILSLTGSYTVSENGGIKSRKGGLSVSLASPDGRVIGGGVAGLLMAASPTQIVVGSFMPNGFKTRKRKHNSEPRVTTLIQGAPDPVSVSRPVSQAAPEDIIYPAPTSVMPVPVPNLGETDNSRSNKNNPNFTSPDSADWNGSEPILDQRPSPCIDLSLPIEQL